MDGKKPLFSADAAEEYFSTLLTYYRNTGNDIFKRDNEERHVSDQIYSAEYQKYLGMQIAMREVLEYFAKFELGDTALRKQENECVECSGIVYRQTNSGKIIPLGQRCGAKITPPCYVPDGDGCSYQIYGDNNDEPIDRCKSCPLCQSDKVRHKQEHFRDLTKKVEPLTTISIHPPRVGWDAGFLNGIEADFLISIHPPRVGWDSKHIQNDMFFIGYK